MTDPSIEREVSQLRDAFAGRWRRTASAPRTFATASHPLGAIAARCDAGPTAAGPLDGWRVAVKDNIAVADCPTALGTGLAGFLSPRDATVVARTRSAGGRIIAKAQCEAYLLGANSFTSRPAPVRNPYAPELSAGGSSSGSAVLVATGEADAALGTDSGGSIRIPAAFCGVVGFKPTRGRVPYTGIAPLEPFLEQAGPIARTVAGVAALFEAIDGADGIDPRCGWWSPAAAPGSGRELTIGVIDAAIDLAGTAVADVVRRTITAASAAGVVVRPVSWTAFDEALDLHLAIYLTGQSLVADAGFAPPGIAASLPGGWTEWRTATGEADVPRMLQDALAAGRALLDADPGLYANAVARALELAAALDDELCAVDALLLPTTPGLPPPIPAAEPTDDAIYGDTRFTAPFNVTGQPALSLPAGRVGRLPVGVQLVGCRGADAALLRAGAALEPVLRPQMLEALP